MQTFLTLCTIAIGNIKTAFFLFVLLCHQLKIITSDGSTVPTLKYIVLEISTYNTQNKF